MSAIGRLQPFAWLYTQWLVLTQSGRMQSGKYLVQCVGTQLLFCLAIVVTASTSVSYAEERIEVSFPIAETQESEKQELERYRKRQGNFWCDPVEFDVEEFFKLAERIQSGESDVRSSIVSVRIRDEKPLEYRGSTSWVEKDGNAVEWGGNLVGAEDFEAHFIVLPTRGRADAIMDSAAGSYRLHSSIYSRIFILCEFDPNRLGHKID
jgi:hypothetical protein